MNRFPISPEAVAEEIRITRNANQAHEEVMTFGDRLSDSVARWGGSWKFIIVAGIVLLIWTLANAFVLSEKWAFDAYPFVFLNLILSMIAALQAPIIMMSQNRQAIKDRIAAQLDYEINCKAENEILKLHTKVDARIETLHQDTKASLDALHAKFDKLALAEDQQKSAAN